MGFNPGIAVISDHRNSILNDRHSLRNPSRSGNHPCAGDSCDEIEGFDEEVRMITNMAEPLRYIPNCDFSPLQDQGIMPPALNHKNYLLANLGQGSPAMNCDGQSDSYSDRLVSNDAAEHNNIGRYHERGTIYASVMDSECVFSDVLSRQCLMDGGMLYSQFSGVFNDIAELQDDFSQTSHDFARTHNTKSRTNVLNREARNSTATSNVAFYL